MLHLYPYYCERSERLAKSLLFAKSEGASRLGNRLLLKHNKLCFALQPFPRLSAKATFADYNGFKKNGAKLPFNFILLNKFVKACFGSESRLFAQNKLRLFFRLTTTSLAFRKIRILRIIKVSNKGAKLPFSFILLKKFVKACFHERR